jgi:four helix bundle protein
MEPAKAVYVATMKMPESVRYGLTSQLRRSAVSIPSNIAEGHGRQGRGDYIRHLRIARGSVAELGTQVELAVDLGMLRGDQQLVDLVAEEARILQALIRSLERLQPEAHA